MEQKKYLYLAAMFLWPFPILGKQTNNPTLETSTSQKQINIVLNKFIHAFLKQDYKKTLKLSEGIQAQYFWKLLNNKKTKTSELKQFKAYFSRLKSYKIPIIEVHPDQTKALAITNFEFRYPNKKGRSWQNLEIKKTREVHYYLKKIGSDWKIIFSKLYQEHHYERSQKDLKWIQRY